METNLPGDEQPPETPPVQPLSTASAPENSAATGPSASPQVEGNIPEPPEGSNEEPFTDRAETSEAHETPPESGVEDAPIGDELSDLVSASQRARLAPANEERMCALLKEALQSGRAGVSRAIEVLPNAPWIVSVRAVEAVWPELTAGFRTQLLAGLGKEETDAARRLRLSLARALFKIDQPVALKVAVAVAKEMRDKDSGALSSKAAQIFANVFIGRAKPWLAQIPLAELKSAEGDMLVHCAVLAVFLIPHPPVTQLGVLKWAQESGRLGKLQENALEAFKKGVSRWSGKWQAALRKEIPELPEEVISVLKPMSPESTLAPRAEQEDEIEARREGEGRDADDRTGESEETTGASDSPITGEDEGSEDDEEREREREDRPQKERLVYEPRPPRQQSPQESARDRDSQRERPVYTPRNAGAAPGQKFNLHEALRQIESHVQSLRTELTTAQAKSRHKEDDRRRPERSSVIVEGERTPEELTRLNHQLEARNLELQSRITELAQHSEDVAASMGVMSDQPVNDTGAQLRALLALKLQEDFADFIALEKESNDLVVQRHYKGLLKHVFEVLTQLEVPLDRGADPE